MQAPGGVPTLNSTEKSEQSSGALSWPSEGFPLKFKFLRSGGILSTGDREAQYYTNYKINVTLFALKCDLFHAEA